MVTFNIHAIATPLSTTQWPGRHVTRIDKPISTLLIISVATAFADAFTTTVRGQVPCHYEVAHIIQGPPCWFGQPAPTAAICISPDGRYVGGQYACSSSGHSFIFDTQTGQMILIPKPGGVFSALPRDVSNRGIAVGSATRCATYPTNCYEWGFIYDMSTGIWTDIQPLNPSNCGALVCGESQVNAINENGQCCGWRTIGTPGGTQLFPVTGFTYDIPSATIADIGMLYGESTGCSDINDSGTFTGSVRVNGIWHSYIFQDGRANDLGSLDGWGTDSLSINEQDAVVGSSTVEIPTFPLYTPNAFRWSDGLMTNLGTLPGDTQSVAYQINNSNTIVGLSRYLTPRTDIARAVVWDQGAIHALDELVEETPIRMTLEFGYGISSDGLIVATGRQLDIDSNSFAVVLSPIRSAPGDIDGNCTVNVDDLLSVINEWGHSSSIADLNGDGIVNQMDLIIVIENWS